jgi:hypothetical protein
MTPTPDGRVCGAVEDGVEGSCSRRDVLHGSKGMKTPNAALAGSYDFMHMMGHVCLGLMWTRMAKAAHAGWMPGRVTGLS